MNKAIPDNVFIELAEKVVDMAQNNVKSGGLPFSSVIVTSEGKIVGQGVNEVGIKTDCTAHAEIQAIRNASANQQSISLLGMTLIASGEPCALCYMAILMAEIKNVVFLSDRFEASVYGFDYLWTYENLSEGFDKNINSLKIKNAERFSPFKLKRQA